MFARSLLALSLSTILMNMAVAAPVSERPLNPQIISNTAVADPIDPLAVTPNNAAAQLSAQEENSASQVSETLLQLEKKEKLSTPDVPTSAPVQTAEVSWSLESLNNAQWVDTLGKGQFPAYARAHVLLNNNHASPGAIDGRSGKNTLKAIASFQQMNGLQTTGELNQETWKALLATQTRPAFVKYTLTEADLKGPYLPSIPTDYALQAKLPGLYYTRVTEMLGEKFHMDEDFLKKINPKATFKKAGETIIVTNIRNDLPEDIHLIVAHKGAKQLYLFNSMNKMIGSFPATIGSTDTPSPTGTYKVKGTTQNPWYSYSPSNFVQGNNLKPLMLPPGPNNPVGSVWIGLSKPSFGIHGTPNPSSISKTASHGCIRLTNWDATDLSKKVKAGVTVKFLE